MNRTGEASRGFMSTVGTAALIGSALLVACENPQPPGLCGTIPEQTVVVGETATVSACFDDANGDMLSFGVSTSDPGTATVRASGSTVTVTAVAPGAAFMTVTATDVTGLSGNQQFRVLVPNRAPIVLGAIDARELPAGESADVDVSGHFAEPDGQELVFAFSVSDESIVSISADGPVVTIAARAKGSATVTVTATDPGGLSATQSFRATVPNRAPAAQGSMPEQTIDVGASAAMDVTEYFSDPDGDALAYTAFASDATVVEVTISGADLTVGPIAKGAATVTVTATDEEGLTATQEFAVTAPNRPPVAAGSMEARTIEVDETADLELSPFFSDPDGDALLFTAAVSDAAVVGASVHDWVLTVGAVAKGEATVTVTATDTEGLTARQEFVVTVPNRGPLATGSIAGQTIEVGEFTNLDLSGHFTDPDGDALTFAATVSEAAIIEASISEAALSVGAAAKGTATVTVTATDTEGLAATLAFAVTVPNRPPLATGSIAERTFEVGETADLDLSDYFSDPDGDALAFTATVSDPQVAGIEVSGSALTATALAKGTATVTVTANDGDGPTATQAWTIGVSNQPPHAVGTIEGPVIGVDETRTIELSDYFGDSDGDALTHTANTSNTGVAGVAVTDGVMTVTAVARGTAGITVTAADADGLEATQAFVVTVPNRAPAAVGALPEMRLTKGGVRRVDPTPGFTDPDGDLLAFEAASSRAQVARAWVSKGEVLVRALKAGTAMVTITAKDSEGMDATQQFSVRVDGSDGSGGSNTNQPPEVVGDIHEQKMEEGDRRKVNASSYFSDPDDDALKFSAESSDTEVVRAKASGSNIELEVVTTGTATVTVTAQDAEGLAASTAFGVAVEEPTQGNRAPVTLGTIADKSFEEDESATLDGSTYFTDPDGDALTYSAESSDVEVLTATASGSVISLQASGHGTATVTVSAEDPAGLDVELNFSVTVARSETPNRPPAAGPIPAQSMKVGITRTLDASTYFGDPDLDELTFSAESSDTDVLTATIAGDDLALVAVAQGTATVTVTGEDPGGLWAETEFQATVAPAPDENKPPYVAYEMDPMTFLKGEGSGDLPWFYIKDPDDDFADLDYAVSSSDNSVFRVVRVNPDDHRPRFRGFYVRAKNKEGQATITLTVTDPGGLSATTSVVHSVGNNPPYTKYTPADTVSRAEGEDHVFFLLPFLFFRDVGLFADDDIGDSMTFAVATSDDSVATAIIGDDLLAPYVKVTAVSLGDATITVTATDKGGLSTPVTFVVTVEEGDGGG
ncbi:MAG: hypothetical protein F4022_03095 [Gemmatimonadetes bacterium]|nr:hypothetical protein [Gemmatimonadota bacterium]MYK65436.1 hypothetical protein [Gemmatimonadota bacterium]